MGFCQKDSLFTYHNCLKIFIFYFIVSGHGRGEDSPGWSSRKEDWSPKDMPFSGVPGPRSKAATIQSDSPADFVELLIDEEVLQLIVQHTNLYAEQCMTNMEELEMPFSRMNAWQPLTTVELRRFLGLYFLTGIVRKSSLAEYWSVDRTIETPYFSSTMSRNRFQLIWRFIHYCDNRQVDHTDNMHVADLVL